MYNPAINSIQVIPTLLSPYGLPYFGFPDFLTAIWPVVTKRRFLKAPFKVEFADMVGMAFEYLEDSANRIIEMGEWCKENFARKDFEIKYYQSANSPAAYFGFKNKVDMGFFLLRWRS